MDAGRRVEHSGDVLLRVSNFLFFRVVGFGRSAPRAGSTHGGTMWGIGALSGAASPPLWPRNPSPQRQSRSAEQPIHIPPRKFLSLTPE